MPYAVLSIGFNINNAILSLHKCQELKGRRGSTKMLLTSSAMNASFRS